MSDTSRMPEERDHDRDRYRPQSLDADAVFERVLFDRWRAMDVVDKAELIDAMARDAADLSRAGVRMRHPAADEREINLRVFALRLGRDLMVRAYGWDPETHGW